MRLDARALDRGHAELKRTVPILVATILVFFAHQALHSNRRPWRSAGASVMLLVSRQPLERSLAGIEWPTLFFFVGLFVMVGALEHTGAIARSPTASPTSPAATAPPSCSASLGSAIGSGLVDNIPFTAAMIPVVDQLQAGNDDDAYWWALALGACFGGNATLVAAAANVAAAGMASRAGQPIGFMTFLASGCPSRSSRCCSPPATSP